MTRSPAGIHASSRKSHLTLLEDVLIAEHLGRFAAVFKGFLVVDYETCTPANVQALKLIYALAARVANGLDAMRTSFQSFVVEQGRAALERYGAIFQTCDLKLPLFQTRDLKLPHLSNP